MLLVWNKCCSCLIVAVREWGRKIWRGGVELDAVETGWCGGGEAGEVGEILGARGRGRVFYGNL